MQGLDGDVDYPTICGTGTEDYFGGAWCFGGGKDPTVTQTYSTPFLGYPLYRNEPGEVPRHGLYRWHVMDPIHFKQDLKVTIQALGWWPNGTFEPLTDDTVLDDSTGHCLGRLLVSGRATRAVPQTAAGSRAMVTVIPRQMRYAAGIDAKTHCPIAIHQQAGYPWGQPAE